MRILKYVLFAIPYAGITQIRFKGYLLSQKRRPLLFGSFFTLNTPRNQARFREGCRANPDNSNESRSRPFMTEADTC
jgi:hypothetical protein